MPGVPARLKELRSRIDAALWRSGRKTAEITLVGVTKTVFPEEIEEAFAAGVKHFGENRWQEAEPKLARLKKPGMEWHFIGRLQSNKLGRILESFDWVQSFADAELLEKAEGHLAALGARRNALLQVNISDEPTKGGFTYDAARGLLGAPLGERFPHLAIRGLMAIGPQAEPPEVRECFRRFCGFFEEAKKVQKSFDTLSLGMSGDFEIAVEEGSTMVRIGSALFGERSYS